MKQKVLKCKQAAAPTAKPKATTAAPNQALAAAALGLPCDQCMAELTEKGTDVADANELCTKVIQCTPAAALEAPTLDCAKCQADLVAKGSDAESAALVCSNVLECTSAMVPTAAPTALPGLPCGKCQTDLVAKGTSAADAALVCDQVLQCDKTATTPMLRMTRAMQPQVASCSACVLQLTQGGTAYQDAVNLCKFSYKCAPGGVQSMAAGGGAILG